ncbi:MULTISPECIES: GDCCVxC domain-containing (seleno)protein [unclassified Thioalkalivibrio]|uniref:GDCCVxC domain-containing (seleno)protein n=1 Tax=unclassified Thioalkalivibrio TaxID=2621013 RepID=UPI0009DA1CED|nr:MULTISPECIES: GDCCVxC domain-containing (seleno)protein [unclassified Thioalkalivibrio]
MNEIVLDSTLTCPECGHEKTETMPVDACQWFYECTGCGVLLRPLPGNCCVFCSFGTVPCPPLQQKGPGGCCTPARPSGR